MALDPEIRWPDTPFPLQDALILVGRRGSEAHGLYVPPDQPDATDDRDLMGVVIPPIRYYYGLSQWENAESIKGPWDVVLFEIKKFVRLLTKQNPNVLSMLWLEPEDYLYVSRFGQRLLDNRGLFAAKRAAFDAFCGYADQQLKLMETRAAKVYKGYMGEKRKALVDKFGYDVKNAAHAIRLLRMGCEYLETGRMNVRRREDREELLDVKHGRWSLENVRDHAKLLYAHAHKVYDKSPLPEELDREKIEALVVDILQEHFEP